MRSAGLAALPARRARLVHPEIADAPGRASLTDEVYNALKWRILTHDLRPGGLFVCDNMLWFGRVAGPDEDPDTRGVRELTRLLHEDPSFLTTILPVRDGVSVSLKIR